jgi:hypothetical protein
MTEQYTQRNINIPNGSRTETPAAGVTDVELNNDDGLVLIDTTNAAVDANLPLASNHTGPITVVATTAFTSGNAVTLDVQAADTLVAPAAAVNPMALDGSTLTAVSDGVNTWYITGGAA